jgi:cytochrome c
VTWDATIIAEYVAKPKEFIPGNKMSFVGLKKAGDLQDLIAYITANCCS